MGESDDRPDVPKRQPEWDFPPIPDDMSLLPTYVADIIARHKLEEESGHAERLVDLLRKQAAKHQAVGDAGKAQQLLDRANQINELSASNSADAENLKARVNRQD